MSAFRRVDAWLRPVAPAERLALTRILVGAAALVYVVVRFRYFADLSSHVATELTPVGVVSVVAAPLPAWATWVIAFATVGLGAAFVAGVFFRATSWLFAAALLWVTTYRSSFGNILHTENLLVLHVVVLALAPSADAIAFDARDREAPAPAPVYGWALRTMTIVTALAYFVAGVAKVRWGGEGWWSGVALGNWLSFDAVRKIELGSFYSPLGPWLAQNRYALRALSVLTLVVELGAPVLLLSRRTRGLWAIAAWSFHAGILATMAIGFFYPLTGIAFASAFELERAPHLRRLATRFTRASSR